MFLHISYQNSPHTANSQLQVSHTILTGTSEKSLTVPEPHNGGLERGEKEGEEEREDQTERKKRKKKRARGSMINAKQRGKDPRPWLCWSWVVPARATSSSQAMGAFPMRSRPIPSLTSPLLIFKCLLAHYQAFQMLTSGLHYQRGLCVCGR